MRLRKGKWRENGESRGGILRNSRSHLKVWGRRGTSWPTVGQRSVVRPFREVSMRRWSPMPRDKA